MQHSSPQSDKILQKECIAQKSVFGKIYPDFLFPLLPYVSVVESRRHQRLLHTPVLILARMNSRKAETMRT